MAQWWRICLPIQEIQVRSLGLEDPLEEDLATRSSILAWRIPWTEEPGGYSLGVPELDATEHMCALVATSSKIKHFHGLLGSLWRSPSLSCSEFILPTTLFHPVPAGHSHCGLTLSTGHLFMAPSWNNILSFCHSYFSVLNIYVFIPTFLLLNIA